MTTEQRPSTIPLAPCGWVWRFKVVGHDAKDLTNWKRVEVDVACYHYSTGSTAAKGYALSLDAVEPMIIATYRLRPAKPEEDLFAVLDARPAETPPPSSRGR